MLVWVERMEKLQRGHKRPDTRNKQRCHGSIIRHSKKGILLERCGLEPGSLRASLGGGDGGVKEVTDDESATLLMSNEHLAKEEF